MTDWNSTATLLNNADSFTKFLHSLLGIFAWEWLVSLDFELAFLFGKRRFGWPMVFYFYGRYAMLGGLVGFVFILDVKNEINCQAAYTALQVIGNTALGVASINLSIRTMAVWSYHRYVVGTLIILILGHFGIILRSVFNSKSTWVDGAGCVTSQVQSTIFAAMYIYTMVLDLIILVLTAYKLGYQENGRYRTAISTLLFRDGLFYFVVAFVGNLIAVVFSLVNLNPIMALIADIPATTFATASQICYSRPELYSASGSPPGAPASNASSISRGVRINVTTFTENDTEDVVSYRTNHYAGPEYKTNSGEEHKTGGLAF
ncbi:hypothetical protein C8J56DRAFT_883359 [Mycena floridula]|nr:hypothetical protein C8J56DRAFT_883359 [Mycena floridula]